MMRGRALALTVWVISLALASVLAARAHFTADLSGFLPAAPTPAQALLVEQLASGPTSRVLLIAIEGADEATRLRLSRDLAARLRAHAAFSDVANGEEVARDGEFLLQHRYAMSNAVDAERFSAQGLRAAIQESLYMLSSTGGLLLADLLPRDPTGEMTLLGLQLGATATQPHSREGLWTSRDERRALLVARTAANGADTDGQQTALAALQGQFAALDAGDARLVVSGPAVFAVQARSSIIREALRLSILGTVLTLALLLYVYRSLSALVLGMAPVVTGALAGVAAVAVGFGVVHGLTLGFGITLIGEAVDYAIYLFVQTGAGPGADADPQVRRAQWLRDFWPTIRMGMLTSVCGFAALLLSGFPGLAQLGLYSVAGLVAAALVTRHVLPRILPRAHRVRDLTAWGERLRALTSRWRVLRLPRVLLLLAAAACAVLLYVDRGSLMQRELASLSPVPLAAQQLDAELRAELGAPDVRHVVVIAGAEREQVLQRTERAAAVLQGLVDAGVLGGFDSPTRFLPSAATQDARRAALPATAALRERLATALQGMPLQAARLEPFVQDVAAARDAAPLVPKALQGTSFAAAVDAMLIESSQGWRAMLPLRTAEATGFDFPAVQRALARIDGAQLLDLKEQSDALYRGYLRETVRLALGGFVALLVLLLASRRSPWRVLRIVLPLLLAVLCTAALLHLAGRQLSLLHVVGMLLTVAIGSNYALFFDGAAAGGPGLDSARTYASVLLACLTSVLGFGVLALSTVPVLQALGETVAPGGVLALLFSALLAAPPHAARSPAR